jgi:rubrerythrin
MAATGKDITGTRDTVYDLVSIIYHALQGAETYGMYVTDAKEVGDTELAKFFQEVQDEERLRADRAKQFLAARLAK